MASLSQTTKNVDGLLGIDPAKAQPLKIKKKFLYGNSPMIIVITIEITVIFLDRQHSRQKKEMAGFMEAFALSEILY